jgi:phosphoribosylformylglycinamidine synthase
VKFGIVTFPGSNREIDASLAVTQGVGADVVHLWHKDHDLQGADVIILPGGFSYGDYLRAGAIARFSPIMREVVEHARRGAPVLGICNGFQILCEAHLLPGVLLRNASLRFASQWVHLRVENADTLFTNAYEKGQLIRVPVAHGDGRYTADADTLKSIEDRGQVAFRYVDRHGNPLPDANPNGSLNDIAAS